MTTELSSHESSSIKCIPEVWIVDLRKIEHIEKYIEMLSEEEKVRANRARNAFFRKRFIVSRALLRYLLSDFLKLNAQSIKFSYKRGGKPYLDVSHQSCLSFNLAHSGYFIFYVFVSNAEIGIDLQEERNDYPAQVVTAFFSKKEQNFFTTLPEVDKLSTFYKIWTHKEALVKALGTGIANIFSSFSVSINMLSKCLKFNDKNWYLLTLSAPYKYHAALACDRPIEMVLYKEFKENF